MFLFNIFSKKKQQKQYKAQKRYYGATTNNLFSSWSASNTTADQQIKKDLATLRARARQLARDNSHTSKFITMLKNGTIGSSGINLQSKIKDANGTYDTYANAEIERIWKEWSKKGACDVTGEYSLRELLNTALSSVAIDGEVLIRKIKNFPNKHGFALQLIEADHLDESYNDNYKNISMGIERNSWGKPIAYHIFKNHPNDYTKPKERIRINATEIIHLYVKERPSQSRGVTWLHTVMNDLNMYAGFAEASLVEKRLTASKMGFYKTPEGEEYIGDDLTDTGEPINEATPGMFEILPSKWDFESYDPKSGNDNFTEFGKAILRNIASGLGVAYSSLSNDLENVNFSSIRAGILEERDFYKSLQNWIIESLLIPVFEQWLEMQLIKQTIKLPFSKFDKFNAPLFMGRGFAWVDPQKDTAANIEAIKNGLKTATQVLSEQGLDLEDVYKQLQKEKEMRNKYNVNIGECDETKTTI